LQIRFVVILLACIFAGLFALLASPTAQAATTLPTKMNFQGRVTGSTGNILANGTYNMRFKIWNAPSGGTQQWSEDRLVSASQGVVVTNGQFSVQLGSVTSLPASVFTSGSLYFEVELPTPASATTSSPIWTEGAMTPRNQLATSAYAYNAETLDGIDSDSFAQLGVSNIFSGSATFSGANNASKLLIQTSGAVDLFKADTSTSTVTIGTAANGAIFTTNGVKYTGTARPMKTVTLSPEYPGATFLPVAGSPNGSNGSLSSDFCSSVQSPAVNSGACGGTEEHNYYAWTTSQGSTQDYGVYIRYRMPSDYDTGSMTNLRLWGKGTASADVVGITMYKGATACGTLADVTSTSTSWLEGLISSPLGGCTIAADDMITFRVILSTASGNTARAGEISFTYRSVF
jgi:hypothetical protein